MHNLTFVTPPHISAAIKPIKTFTDNRHNRPKNFSTVIRTVHSLCGHRQRQCAARSTEDVVRACNLRSRTDRKDQR